MNPEEAPHISDVAAPCYACGAKWLSHENPDISGAVMDHAEDCAYLKAQDDEDNDER